MLACALSDRSSVCRAGKDVVPAELQEVLAPGSAITDVSQSRVSLWGAHVPLGAALLINAQASWQLPHA